MVHLNITLDEELYQRLKAKAPAKKYRPVASTEELLAELRTDRDAR